MFLAIRSAWDFRWDFILLSRITIRCRESLWFLSCSAYATAPVVRRRIAIIMKMQSGSIIVFSSVMSFFSPVPLLGHQSAL